MKCGTTLPHLREAEGDFEKWIIARSGFGKHLFIVKAVYDKQALPRPESIAGVIITGSHDNVTANDPWMAYASRWIRQAIAHELPHLGICFGHQLLAHALGGEVDFNPNGIECGTVEIEKYADWQSDALLSALPQSFKVQLSHAQSVLKLPARATSYAGSWRDKNQICVFAKNVWGVQFHPEFSATVTSAYLQHQIQSIVAQGDDIAQLKSQIDETPEATALLRRFCEIVEQVPRERQDM